MPKKLKPGQRCTNSRGVCASVGHYYHAPFDHPGSDSPSAGGRCAYVQPPDRTPEEAAHAYLAPAGTSRDPRCSCPFSDCKVLPANPGCPIHGTRPAPEEPQSCCFEHLATGGERHDRDCVESRVELRHPGPWEFKPDAPDGDLALVDAEGHNVLYAAQAGIDLRAASGQVLSFVLDACNAELARRARPQREHDPQNDAELRRKVAGIFFGQSGQSCRVDSVWVDKMIDLFQGRRS